MKSAPLIPSVSITFILSMSPRVITVAAPPRMVPLCADPSADPEVTDWYSVFQGGLAGSKSMKDLEVSLQLSCFSHG